MSDNLPPGISRDDTVHGEIYYTAAQVRAAIEASRAAVPAGPDVQWQKRHPLRTEGAWENTQEHDAKWWRDHSQGWEIRVLYAHPVTQAKPEQAAQQWMPIETAPKDGTAVLVAEGRFIYCVEWNDEFEWWAVDDNKLGPFRLRGAAPTHWMPLPAAPQPKD